MWRKALTPFRMPAIVALLIVMIVGIFPIFAEATAVVKDVDITFEGTYVLLEGHGLSVLLPNDWLVFQAESSSVVFMAGNAERSRFFWVEFYSHNGTSLESIAQMLLESGQCTNLLETSFQGAPFLCYDQVNGNSFVALTVSNDGKYLYIFNFLPQEDLAFRTLATQIMASILTVQE